MGMPDFGFTDNTPAWLTALYNILTYIAVAFVIILLLGLLIYAVYKLIRKFYRPMNENDDVHEFISPNKETRENFFRTIKRETPLWRDFSPEAQVRKLYRKTVLKKKVEIDSNAYTPTEVEKLVGLDNPVLHGVYEQARYSQNGVTADEAKALKSQV